MGVSIINLSKFRRPKSHFSILYDGGQLLTPYIENVWEIMVLITFK